MQATAPTVAEFATDFLTHQTTPEASRKGANKETTIETKRKEIQLYLLPELADLPITEVDDRRIARLVARLHSRKLSHNTIANVMITLQRMLRVAEQWGYLESVPRINSAHKRRPDLIDRDAFLSYAELRSFLAAAQEHTEHHGELMLMAKAGLRVGEVRGLHWQHVELRQSRLVLRTQYTHGVWQNLKSGRARIVPLPGSAIEMLRLAKRRGVLVFGNGTDPIGYSTIWRACLAAGRFAKLRLVNGRPKDVNPHMLRHTWASHCMMRGVAPIKVQRWGGWQSLQMLEIYSHLALEDCASEVECLDLPATGPGPANGPGGRES